MTKKSISAKAFGEVLKELRLERGLTQDKLAELASLNDRSHVSMLERGEKSPVLDTILHLANSLSISANELISLVEQKLKSSNH